MFDIFYLIFLGAACGLILDIRLISTTKRQVIETFVCYVALGYWVYMALAAPKISVAMIFIMPIGTVLYRMFFAGVMLPELMLCKKYKELNRINNILNYRISQVQRELDHLKQMRQTEDMPETKQQIEKIYEQGKVALKNYKDVQSQILTKELELKTILKIRS